jgi:hypothetical protein
MFPHNGISGPPASIGSQSYRVLHALPTKIGSIGYFPLELLLAQP